MAMEAIPNALRSYMDSASIALTLSRAHVPDLPLVYVNEAFERLTGHDRGFCVGKNCRFLQGTYREQESLVAVRAFLADERLNNLRVTLVNFRRDGRPFVNLLSMTKLRDLDRRLQFIFASQFDVSRARSDQLIAYDESLTDSFPLPGPVAREAGLILSGSLAAIADAASTIAQARLTISDVENSDQLF